MVNLGIWRRPHNFTKKRDLQLDPERYHVKTILPVTRLTDINERKVLDAEKTQEIQQHGLDALALLTHLNYELKP